MHSSRKIIYLLEHSVGTILLLHGVTCIWHGLRNDVDDINTWKNRGYQVHIGNENINFNKYYNINLKKYI